MSVGNVGSWKHLLILATIAIAILSILVWVLRITQMPLKSFTGELVPLSAEETELSNNLSRHVKYLSETIGERNLSKPSALQAAADYIKTMLQHSGYPVTEQTYSVRGHQVSNLEAKLLGSENGRKTIVVGAHYDSAEGSPGANDNASGVAAVLELAQLFRGFRSQTTFRFVLFVNEESPYFQTDDMGSMVYARQLRSDQIPVSAMISMETIGFYSEARDSQKYPELLGLFYPNHGNFIAFVGNSSSRTLVRKAVRRFRETTRFPSQGIAAPEEWPGIGWSDNWSFWQEQYPAIMVTDTAVFRYPYYHTSQDTANHVDFARMAQITNGVRRALEFLSTEN